MVVVVVFWVGGFWVDDTPYSNEIFGCVAAACHLLMAIDGFNVDV